MSELHNQHPAYNYNQYSHPPPQNDRYVTSSMSQGSDYQQAPLSPQRSREQGLSPQRSREQGYYAPSDNSVLGPLTLTSTSEFGLSRRKDSAGYAIVGGYEYGYPGRPCESYDAYNPPQGHEGYYGQRQYRPLNYDQLQKRQHQNQLDAQNPHRLPLVSELDAGDVDKAEDEHAPKGVVADVATGHPFGNEKDHEVPGTIEGAIADSPVQGEMPRCSRCSKQGDKIHNS